jgi:hypothetical protein
MVLRGTSRALPLEGLKRLLTDNREDYLPRNTVSFSNGPSAF